MDVARQDGHRGAITEAWVNVFVLPAGAVGKRTAQMHTPEIFKRRLSLSNICAIIMLYMTVRRVKQEQSGGRVKIQTAKCHSEGTVAVVTFGRGWFVVSCGAGSPVAAVNVSTDSKSDENWEMTKITIKKKTFSCCLKQSSHYF